MKATLALIYIAVASFVVLTFASFNTASGATNKQELPATGKPPIIVNPQGKQIPLYAGSYALVISNANYKNWEKLPSTVSELDAITDALRKNGFLVVRLTDLTSADMLSEIQKFFQNYGRKEKNSRIVMYYAGHGFVDQETDDGYLVPVDADPQKANSNLMAQAVAMEDVRNAGMRMLANQGLFVFDNCYSGIVFKGRSDGEVPRPAPRQDAAERWRSLRSASEQKGRQFLAGGTAKQIVAGKSPVAVAFVDGLTKGATSKYNDGYVTAAELALHIKTTATTRMQSPQWMPLGGFSGDMVFQVQPAEQIPGVKVTLAADAFFDYQDTEIKPEAKAKLLDLLTKLRGVRVEVVIVVAHSDDREGDSELQRIAITDLRTRKIQDFLVSQGLERDRFYLEGKGSKQPVADNRTTEGRAKNRRVEIEAVGTRPVN